jgi:hypothetical protein
MVVRSLHFPQFLGREDRIMAGIKKSSLPVFRLGRTATEPVVTVTEGGQLRFNVLAMKAFGEPRKLFIDFDEKSRELKMQSTSTPPKGWADEDLFDLKDSKGGGGYTSCSAIFSSPEVGIKYDCKASGNQHFKPTLDATKRKVSFVIPKGALAPLPKQVRAKKAPAAKAAAAGAGAASEEIVLD